MNTSAAFAARHTCDSPEWYTPSPYVEAAREVMGSIHYIVYLGPVNVEAFERGVESFKRVFSQFGQVRI